MFYSHFFIRLKKMGASIRNTENRLIIQSLNDYGIENFTLAIYKIDPKLFEIEFKPLEYSRALEQYYIFNSNSVLNSIKVAGASPAGPMDENTKLSIGKANSKPLYNHDKSILHYTAVSTVSFLQKVQTSQSTLRNYLASGKALVGKFVFSREFYPGVEIQLMDSTDLSELIAEGKTEQNLVRLTNPETKKKMLDSNHQKMSITLIDIETKKEYFFVSLNRASNFTRSFSLNKTRDGKFVISRVAGVIKTGEICNFPSLNNERYISLPKLMEMKSGDSYKGFIVRRESKAC